MSSGLPAKAVRRLDQLAAEYQLTSSTVAALAALLHAVARDPYAPTTVTDPVEAVDRHIADSLAALRTPSLLQAQSVADLGSGAGFPGLALAAALPETGFWLVESNARKCDFIARAAAAAGIPNASPVAERAETWVAGRGAHDVVTARALAPLGVVAELAAPLLREGGTLIAWTGQRDDAAEAQAQASAEILGMRLDNVISASPFQGAQHRNLHLMSKVSPTPSRFPRRPGMARKRPLGRSASPSDRVRR